MMKQLRTLQKDSQGFTLVELMIVVAIIGILAAIAIPQFAAYRIRGFNASALSDVRNLNTSQAAYFSDWQTYGKTEQALGADIPLSLAAATGDTGAGALATIAIAGTSIPVITSFDNGGTIRALQIPIGNGVGAVATTDAAVAPALATSMVAISKHVQGDTFFAVDSDSSAIYQDNSSAKAATGIGYIIVPGIEPTSVASKDDFANVNGPSGSLWTIK